MEGLRSGTLGRTGNFTANDKELCAFLRLNMSTKGISAITFQSIDSIKKARFWVKKKLVLGKEEGLLAYLSGFSVE